MSNNPRSTDGDTEREWLVLLLGGASGVGKTHVSYRLAQHYHAGLTEVDDFQVVLEAMTTPEQYPVLHYWRLHTDEALAMTEEQRIEYMLSYDRVMDEALTLVIANHLETHAPVVLEGDFILPSLALKDTYGDEPSRGLVRAVFLLEDSEDQLRHNYRARENEEQHLRARASWRHSQWIEAESRRLGISTVQARPWDTVLERVIAVIDDLSDRSMVRMTP